MKYLFFSVLVGLGLSVGCTPPGDAGGGGTDDNLTVVEPQETTEVSVVKIDVPGITCAGCAGSVRETLEACDGIVSVEVDPSSKIATAKTTTDFDPQNAIDRLTADKRFVGSNIIQ